MFDLATIKDAAPEFDENRVPLFAPQTPEWEEARVDNLRRFQEFYLASLGIDPRYAILWECTSDATRPHFGKGDWLIIDGSKRTVRTEEFYVLREPDIPSAPHLKSGFMVRSVAIGAAGINLIASNKPYYTDKFIARADVSELEVLGVVRSVIKNPHR